MKEHLARHWGDWASVVGLVFSFLAFVFSKRASKAAKEAKNSVLQRSFGQDVSEANRIAAEIVRLVSVDRLDLASLRAADLMNQTSYLIARWRDQLPENGITDFVIARELLLSISAIIVKVDATDMTAAQRSKLTRACHKVNLIFSEQHGDAIRAIDNEV